LLTYVAQVLFFLAGFSLRVPSQIFYGGELSLYSGVTRQRSAKILLIAWCQRWPITNGQVTFGFAVVHF